MKNGATQQYLHRLKKNLHCPHKEKKKLLSQGESLWKTFLDENPNCTYEDLVSAFGSPEVFAGEMLATLDQKALKQAQTRRKLFQRCTAILVAAVLVLGAVFWYGKYARAVQVVRAGRFHYCHRRTG